MATRQEIIDELMRRGFTQADIAAAVGKQTTTASPGATPTGTSDPSLLEQNIANVGRQVENIPESGATFLSDLATLGDALVFGPGELAQHHLLGTAKGSGGEALENIGGLARGFFPGATAEQHEAAKAFGPSLIPTPTGSVEDPVGEMAKATGILAPLGAAAGAAVGGRAGAAARNVSRVAASSDPAILTARGAQAVGGKTRDALTQALGSTTDIGAGNLGALRRAGGAGGRREAAAREFLTEEKTGVDLVQQPHEALRQRAAEMGRQHEAFLRDNGLDQIQIDITDLRDDITRALEEVQQAPLAGEVEGVRLGTVASAQQGDVQRALAAVQDAGDRLTALELDTLKRQLDDFTTDSTMGGVIVGRVADRVRSKLDENVPGYTEQMGEYRDFLVQREQIARRTGLNAGKRPEALNERTALAGLSRALDENRDFEALGLGQIEAETGLPLTEQVAGFRASQGLSPSRVGRNAVGGTLIGGGAIGGGAIGALFDPVVGGAIGGLALLSASPRTVGRMMIQAGKRGDEVQRITDAVTLLQHQARQMGLPPDITIAQALQRGTGEPSDSFLARIGQR